MQNQSLGQFAIAAALPWGHWAYYSLRYKGKSGFAWLYVKYTAPVSLGRINCKGGPKISQFTSSGLHSKLSLVEMALTSAEQRAVIGSWALLTLTKEKKTHAVNFFLM